MFLSRLGPAFQIVFVDLLDIQYSQEILIVHNTTAGRQQWIDISRHCLNSADQHEAVKNQNKNAVEVFTREKKDLDC